MTYRNDHDAALARVDALQLEVKRLAAEKEAAKLAAVQPVRRRGAKYFGLGGALVGIVSAIGLWFVSPGPRVSEASVAVLDTRTDRALLDACIAEIGPASFDRADATAAPCRLELRAFAHDGLWSPTERDALEGWIRTEDRLANSIAMVREVMREHPAQHNGDAEQLRTEYIRAAGERDAAIALWRGTR